MWRLIVLLTVTVAACAGVAVLYGGARWRKGTDELRARLHALRVPLAPTRYDTRELDGLPPPVQRYLRTVLTEGQPMIAVARFAHSGTFNMGDTTPNWRAFSSTQLVITRRPGFDWDGRVQMAPGVNVFVHDAYVAGEGVLHAELLGLVPLADVRGTPEAAHGELLRYLAEAMWYPTALLPSQGVTWTAIDGTSARATLTDGATTASLDFRFSAAGFIESSYAAARPRMVGGAVTNAPWSGRGWGYDVRDGMRIPLDAEVAWMVSGGLYPYWRGRLTNIEYEFAH